MQESYTVLHGDAKKRPNNYLSFHKSSSTQSLAPKIGIQFFKKSETLPPCREIMISDEVFQGLTPQKANLFSLMQLEDLGQRVTSFLSKKDYDNLKMTSKRFQKLGSRQEYAKETALEISQTLCYMGIWANGCCCGNKAISKSNYDHYDLDPDEDDWYMDYKLKPWAALEYCYDIISAMTCEVMRCGFCITKWTVVFPFAYSTAFFGSLCRDTSLGADYYIELTSPEMARGRI